MANQNGAPPVKPAKPAPVDTQMDVEALLEAGGVEVAESAMQSAAESLQHVWTNGRHRRRESKA